MKLVLIQLHLLFSNHTSNHYAYKTARKLAIRSFNRIITLSIAINSLCLKPVRLKFWYLDSSVLQNSKSCLACTLSVMGTANKKRKTPPSLLSQRGLMCRNAFGNFLVKKNPHHWGRCGRNLKSKMWRFWIIGKIICIIFEI